MELCSFVEGMACNFNTQGNFSTLRGSPRFTQLFSNNMQFQRSMIFKNCSRIFWMIFQKFSRKSVFCRKPSSAKICVIELSSSGCWPKNSLNVESTDHFLNERTWFDPFDVFFKFLNGHEPRNQKHNVN